MDLVISGPGGAQLELLRECLKLKQKETVQKLSKELTQCKCTGTFIETRIDSSSNGEYVNTPANKIAETKRKKLM